MDVQAIECKKIEFLKTDGTLRTFNKEFAAQLAASIKVEGMHNAIVVRPNPAKAGFFIGVQGKHRWFAKAKILKDEVIDCSVIVDMDDADAEMATISENLWRNPLKKNQHLLSIKRWWEHYAAKNPDSVGRGVAGSKAAAKKRSDTKSADDAKPEGVAAGGAGDTKTANFAEMVSAATGASLSTAKRDARLAKAFDDEQIEALTQMQTSLADQGTIAKIKNKQQRDEIVNLIASGMEAADAIADVMKDAPVTANEPAKPKSKSTAEGSTNNDKDPGLSDDEWYAKYCSEKGKLLKDPARFKADALLFRHVSDLRHAFRTKAKKFVAEQKQSGVFSGFFFLVKRFISVSHPKDWFLCDECMGTGTSKLKGIECKKCSQSGYLLKTEDYV